MKINVCKVGIFMESKNFIYYNREYNLYFYEKKINDIVFYDFISNKDILKRVFSETNEKILIDYLIDNTNEIFTIEISLSNLLKNEDDTINKIKKSVSCPIFPDGVFR